MSAELRYFHAREGDVSPLRVQIVSDGPHGAVGEDGISPSTGFPPGQIDPQGWLKRDDGSPYRINADTLGRAVYRLTVIRSGVAIKTLTFPPRATDGVIDVNLLGGA